MIEFYLDSVDLVQIRRFKESLPLKGVTTNPTILANAGVGLAKLLPELSIILGEQARFHVQVVSHTVEEMVEEARHIDQLPYDMVVKVPATETGLIAIQQMKVLQIKTLATAIYNTQQGFCAALAGADYLAPYVNRMDMIGGNGIAVVAELQGLISQYGLPTLLLPASFKNTFQVIEVMKLGVGAITVPVDVMAQMFAHPATEKAVEQFSKDWEQVFANKLSFQSE